MSVRTGTLQWVYQCPQIRRSKNNTDKRREEKDIVKESLSPGLVVGRNFVSVTSVYYKILGKIKNNDFPYLFVIQLFVISEQLTT